MQQEEFEQAIRDFNRADEIEKSAKDLRSRARTKILSYLNENGTMPRVGMEKFSIEAGLGVKVTVPVKAGLPSRFNTERTEEFYRIVEDALPHIIDDVFKQHPEFLPDEWMAAIKTWPSRASEMASMLLPFVLPATEPEPMSPRVESK